MLQSMGLQSWTRHSNWTTTIWKIYGLWTHLDLASEEAMAPHSSTLAWKIPWTEEPGGLQSMGSLRVGRDWATSLSRLTFMHWRSKWRSHQYSCLENPRDGGPWWAAVYGFAQSWTRLRRLSSRSSSSRSGFKFELLLFNGWVEGLKKLTSCLRN